MASGRIVGAFDEPELGQMCLGLAAEEVPVVQFAIVSPAVVWEAATTVNLMRAELRRPCIWQSAMTEQETYPSGEGRGG